MQGSKAEHSCPAAAHDVHPHGSERHKTTARSDKLQQTEQLISPVLDGAEAFLWNHVCKSKINPRESSVTVHSGSLNIPSVRLCSSVSSVCCWQRCVTVFILRLGGGRHRNCKSFVIGSTEIQRLSLSCGLVVCLFGYTERWFSTIWENICFVILTWWSVGHYSA